MNWKQYILPVIFLIFLINAASAADNYVTITATPGEDLSRTLSFEGAYKRLFATADASGTASLWVTPRRLDFGAIDPGETIERDYFISVPKGQRPGYYELVWKYTCKYTDGSTCTVAGNTIVRITVEAQPSSTSSGVAKKSVSIDQGEELRDYLSFSARSDETGLYAWADASGTAASWVTPRRIDFGVIQPGDSVDEYYTIRVPKNQRPGNYDLTWTWGCGYTSGASCSPVTTVTVIQITVGTSYSPVYTPLYTPVYTPVNTGADDAVIAGVIIFSIIMIVFFVIWVYVVIWVARDANKRGKSGTLWGILTFFLGILGLVIYLLVRPGGNIVQCNYCRKEKLETLPVCPHCKNSTAPAYRPAPAPMTAPHPPAPRRTETLAADTNAQKEKLNKINALLEKLDEKLAQGEITEARYTQLRGQYCEEAEKLKSQITEKELMKEVGLEK